MKKIKINSIVKEVNSDNLHDLRLELGISDDTITIYKGFATDENLKLNDNDSVIFIKK